MGARFKLIFDMIQEDETSARLADEVQALQPELEAVEELRRLAFELDETQPKSYTAT